MINITKESQIKGGEHLVDLKKSVDFILERFDKFEKDAKGKNKKITILND